MIEGLKRFIDNNNLFLKIFLITFLFIISSIFLTKSWINIIAVNGNVDLKPIYDLSKSFWNKDDIFKDISIGDPIPLWNHLLYIIFYPYTLFTFKITKILWFCSNLIFTLLTILILKKAHNLSINRSLILGIIVLSSTPFTNTLGNGQLGLFLLVSLLFYWYSNYKVKVIFLSTAYIKFSFAPFFLINSFFKKEIDVIYAILISVFAVIIYGIYIGDLKIIEFFNPLLSILSVIKANKETFIGDVNNFHIRALFSNLGLSKYYIFGMLIFSLLNVLVIFFIKKNNDLLFLIICVSSLFIFYHNYYDLVFLIPLASYLLKSNISNVVFFINFPIILWFFYFVRFNELILDQYFSLDFMNIMGSLLLVVSYLSLYFQNLKERNEN